MKRILVVDDNVTNLLLAQSALDELYKVTLLTAGTQVLHFLKNNTADLILLDILMPDMNGFSTLQELRKLENGKDVPVLFFSAVDDKENIKLAIELGNQHKVSGYILKPFDKDELLKRVTQVIN